jgi:hypothetical protein
MVVGEILLAVSLLLLTLTSVGALAADVKTQTSIQYLWYNDPFQDKTQGYLLQYVKLSATKIDAAGRFSTVRYGRLYFLYMDSLDELDDGALNGFVSFSGKAAFSR